MFKLLDYMEYDTDAAAQTAYPNNVDEEMLNGNCETWSGGDSVAPDNWVYTASPSGSIAKESTIIHSGTYSAKLITTNTCWFNNTSSFVAKGIDYFKGKSVTFSCWVWASVADKVWLDLNDGDGATASIKHPGDSAWHKLTVTRVIHAGATHIWCYVIVDGVSTTVYADDASCKVDVLNSYSESTIKTQGSYALKGVATTGALNKTLTRTIDPTINLTGINQVRFRIRSSRTGSNIKIGLHDSGGTTTEITPNILSADTWQEVKINLQNVINANKDAIDSIIITIVNADAENTFYTDELISYTLPQIVIN